MCSLLINTKSKTKKQFQVYLKKKNYPIKTYFEWKVNKYSSSVEHSTTCSLEDQNHVTWRICSWWDDRLKHYVDSKSTPSSFRQ